MPTDALAVLTSGGLDSAVVLADARRRGAEVWPLYIRCGLLWEPAELAHLKRLLAALPGLHPLAILEEPVAEVYGRHWSVTGLDSPAADSPDADVFLPGRNVLLLGKALVWCHLRGIPALALGSLSTNPFPDATPAFFRNFAALVDTALGSRVEVRLPLANLSKTAVMRLGDSLPWQHTFSCIRPRSGQHCGRCNKCAERQRAFAEAGLTDPTHYA